MNLHGRDDPQPDDAVPAGGPPPLPVDRGLTPLDDEPAPKKKRWKWLLWLGIPVVILLGLVACGLLFEFLSKEVPVDDEDRRVVLRASHFVDYLEDFEPDPGAETYEKLKYIDGSYDLTYEYEHPDEDEGIYILCSVTVERNASDAIVSYTALHASSKLGIGLSDVSFEERDDLVSWGDKSNHMLVKLDDGGYVGNYFIARSGKRIIYLWFTGVYFDDGTQLRSLLMPVLNAVQRYDPE